MCLSAPALQAGALSSPSPLPPPTRCGPQWAGTRGGWGRGKQVAELGQLPLRLSPGWLAVCRVPGSVPGGGPAWSLPPESSRGSWNRKIHTWKGKEWAGGGGRRPRGIKNCRESPGVVRAGHLWKDGPSPGETLGTWALWTLAPPPAAGPPGLGSDRDIYNSQLCGPGPN